MLVEVRTVLSDMLRRIEEMERQFRALEDMVRSRPVVDDVNALERRIDAQNQEIQALKQRNSYLTGGLAVLAFVAPWIMKLLKII